METIREITSHQVDPINKALKICVHDKPGPGGASTLYSITVPNMPYGSEFTNKFTAPAMFSFKFQSGSAPGGVHGITSEALLAILIDRLEGFQTGPFANAFNEKALEHLIVAKGLLEERTKMRIRRGVEGTHTP